jgi:Kef-type K+ transport system membrane component KefB
LIVAVVAAARSSSQRDRLFAMDLLFSLLVALVIFAIVGCGLWLICKKFELPQPALWICGALLILILFGYLIDKAGLYHFHG